jgi:hypothetical protein
LAKALVVRSTEGKQIGLGLCFGTVQKSLSGQQSLEIGQMRYLDLHPHLHLRVWSFLNRPVHW